MKPDIKGKGKINKKLIYAGVAILLVLVGAFLLMPKSVAVSQIGYVAEGAAFTGTDGVRYDIQLWNNDKIVYDAPHLFSGHSCVKCPAGKIPVNVRSITLDPAIKADTLVVTAYDVETNYQYIRINTKNYNIPTAADQAIITYTFDLTSGEMIGTASISSISVLD